MADYRALCARAVRVPFDGVEDVWREYDQFEGQVNRVTVSSSSPAGVTTGRCSIFETSCGSDDRSLLSCLTDQTPG